MLDMNPMLLCDTYKTVHNMMYPEGLTKLVSYWVPRKSYFKNEENQKMVWFGLQAFLKEYLVEYFGRNFFGKNLESVMSEYKSYMDVQLGSGGYRTEHIEKLHNLGYLPLEIKALPEGSLVNMGVPCIEVSNTNPEFAWLVQWLECVLQPELWKICNHATIGHMYHRLARRWYSKTVDDGVDVMDSMSDFGMRGMSCIEESTRCSAAWLLSFNKTSTIPALEYIDRYYWASTADSHIGRGAVSTEHSVMGANFAIDGNERTFVKRLLTELYPNTSFSMVSDTYDYWNMVESIIPSLKDEVLAHNGKLLIRPDSGDQFSITVDTVKSLWMTFGGTTNSKGYKVLDPHVGVILGDGSTLSVVEKIWAELERCGFASNNVVFGVGAFCFTAPFEGDRLVVNTRDMFGCACKATFGVIDGKEVFIYKDPKTDTNSLKKSHKGLVFVEKTPTAFKYTDELDSKAYGEYAEAHENAMVTVFRDGDICNEESFKTIRDRLANEE